MFIEILSQLQNGFDTIENAQSRSKMLGAREAVASYTIRHSAKYVSEILKMNL